MQKPERLQKILSQMGVCSRRTAEEWIQDELITVNGQVATLGTKVDPTKDAIKVKGKLLTVHTSFLTLAFYKPKGVISAFSDPHGRPCLKDVLKNIRKRLYPIGRMDFNSEGLLLLTNNGDYAEKIQKAKNIIRTYAIKIKGSADEEIISRIEGGARIRQNSLKLIKPVSVTLQKRLKNKSILEVQFKGPGALDIKKLFEARALLIDKIVRTGIGTIHLEDLLPGQYRILKNSDLQALLAEEKK